MSVPQNELLIDYIDNLLDENGRQQVETLLAADATAAEDYESHLFSVSLVREAGLQMQVAEVRRQFEAAKEPAIVRPMFSKVMRIAAMVIVLVGAAAAYRYTSTNASGIYNESFSSYELNTSRGSGNLTDLENAYRNKDWATVNTLYNSMATKNQKAEFLAGMASLELKQFETAVIRFRSVMAINAGVKESLYQEEAEYYLAMALLGAGKGAEGSDILKNIRGNKDHIFHDKAQNISALDLKVLTIKGNKQE